MNPGDWINCGLLVVAIIGIPITLWQLHQAIKSQKIQLLHSMTNEQRNLHLKILELAAVKQKGSKIDDKDKRKTLVTEYLNYLENLALLINEKYIDEPIAKKIFYLVVVNQTPENFREEINDAIYKEYAALRNRWGSSKRVSRDTNTVLIIFVWVGFIAAIFEMFLLGYKTFVIQGGAFYFLLIAVVIGSGYFYFYSLQKIHKH